MIISFEKNYIIASSSFQNFPFQHSDVKYLNAKTKSHQRNILRHNMNGFCDVDIDLIVKFFEVGINFPIKNGKRIMI